MRRAQFPLDLYKACSGLAHQKLLPVARRATEASNVNGPQDRQQEPSSRAFKASRSLVEAIPKP